MPTYTVHAPPPPEGQSAPERFVFLRDGFHFWAFIAPTIWLLVYRQWLALVIYLVGTAAVVGGLVWLKAGTAAVVGAALCFSLLLGFEAATVRRWTFARRGWTMLGFVVGQDVDEAERRFFDRWSGRVQPPSPEPPVPPSTPSRRDTSRDVIGLFPTPGNAR
jgi:hypothetical protein